MPSAGDSTSTLAFVGHHLDQRLAARDWVTGLLQPQRDECLGGLGVDFGQRDDVPHQVVSSGSVSMRRTRLFRNRTAGTPLTTR